MRRAVALALVALLGLGSYAAVTSLLGDDAAPPPAGANSTAGPTPGADDETRHTDPPSAGSTPRTTTPAHVDRPREQVQGYDLSPLRPQRIPDGWQPYQSGQVQPVPFGRVDDRGVRMFLADWDGLVYDHPIAQAQYALAALESYRLTDEQEYLDVALANARRIANRHEEIDGAWYFPYAFDFDLYRNDTGVLRAPWTSGMASGQALSTFARLYQVTGDETWREAADRTFAAFQQAPDGRGWFSSWVDEDRMLWLEEYSRYPVETSERVLNGHMWSMYGLWDYWAMHDYDHPQAERLWRGAMHTVDHHAMPTFRNPGWYSYYSVWQHRLAPTYHTYHQEQFLMLYRMSHDPVWVERAWLYRDDHPERKDVEDGVAVLTPRVRTAYRLDDSASHVNDRTMAVRQTRQVRFPRRAEARFDRRGRIPDGPRVLRLASGPHAGWWVEEGAGQAWSRAPIEEHRYRPAVELGLTEARTLAVYRYDDNGRRVDARQVMLTPGQAYRSERSAIVEGRPSWQLSGGDLDGWWLPGQSTVQLTGPDPG